MQNVSTPIDVSDTSQVWTEDARRTWQEMVFHTQKLANYFGPRSKEYVDAVASLAHISASLIGWGTLRVSKDGDLSLFCNTGGFVFGLIWHGIQRRCTVEGCHAYANDDGHVWTYNRDHHRCDNHKWAFPLDAPRPGTWSFHS